MIFELVTLEPVDSKLIRILCFILCESCSSSQSVSYSVIRHILSQRSSECGFVSCREIASGNVVRNSNSQVTSNRYLILTNHDRCGH